MPRQFSEKQLRFMDFLEQCYYITSGLPSKDKALAAVPGLTASEYARWIESDDVLNHMSEVRGIDLRETRNTEALTAEQLVVANTLLNLSDKRSERNKLKDLKVSPAKYEAWKKDPAFQQYMRHRAEAALGEAIPDIHMALIDVAKRGDISGIKLAYEMTGRWSSKTVGDLNVEFLLMKVIEVIQRHITDPEKLISIADDLALLTGAVPGQPQVMQPVTQQALPSHSIYEDSRVKGAFAL